MNDFFSLRNPLLCWLGLWVGLLPGLVAQSSLAPATNTYALTHVHVVTAPGELIQNATVVVEDGLITAVGTDVAIPGNARLMRMDSMYVYAGFIDGLGHAGIERPKETPRGQRERPKGDQVANPTPERAGIQPDRMATEMLNPKEKSISDWRKAGFTLVHSVPYGKMLPGQGSLILLAGDKAKDMVLEDAVSVFAQWQSASGVYPGTLLGVLATWRNLYRQAKLNLQHSEAYAANPSGMERPERDPVLEAFHPVIKGELPVVLKAESYLDIQRALTLQQELGFPLILANLKHGTPVLDQVKAQNIPVFLSLDLPKAEKKGKEEDSDDEMTASEKELAALKARKKAAQEARVIQAAKFAEAGLTFGFSTQKAKSKDIQANLRRMIEAGLPAETALAALTTHPAKMLGLEDQLGTVSTGKIANLVVSDKPFFEEKSQIRYVFVDGHPFKMEVKKKKAKKKEGESDAPAVNVAGSWAYSTESPQGTTTGTIIINGEPGSYDGTMESAQMGEPADLEGIQVDGQTLTFSFSFDAGGQMITLDFEVEVDGDSFSGTMSVGAFGEFPIEAERTSKPD